MTVSALLVCRPKGREARGADPPIEHVAGLDAAMIASSVPLSGRFAGLGARSRETSARWVSSLGVAQLDVVRAGISVVAANANAKRIGAGEA